MSTLRQSLRRVLARTLRRGASWLDRLAVRVTPAAPAAPDADDSPTGGPPAHWRQRVHRPPPVHWLARIRQQAPHLLDGEALAGTGWTRITVSPPAVPPVGVTPTADEAAPRPLPGDRPPPAATGQPEAVRPPQRAMPLFAGHALHLRRAGSSPWTGRGASPAEAPPESSPHSSAPAGSSSLAWPVSPAYHPAGAPDSAAQQPGGALADRRAVPMVAVAEEAAGRNTSESPGLPSMPPAGRSSRAGPAGSSPVPAGESSAGSTPGFYPAAGREAAPTGEADASLTGSTTVTRNWPSAAPPPNGGTVQQDTTPDLAASDFKVAGTTHESPGWTRAALWPDWRAVRPPGALERLDASANDRATAAPDHRAALPWPALPDWPDRPESEPNPHEAVRQHLQRLDREQRGFLWNESPF